MTRRPIRDNIINQVLEAAKDNGDEIVVAACRRLIWASTLGWKRHANRNDVELVWSLA